jgi:hypothetical protein
VCLRLWTTFFLASCVVQNALDNVSNKVGVAAGAQDANATQLDPFRCGIAGCAAVHKDDC